MKIKYIAAIALLAFPMTSFGDGKQTFEASCADCHEASELKDVDVVSNFAGVKKHSKVKVTQADIAAVAAWLKSI